MSCSVVSGDSLHGDSYYYIYFFFIYCGAAVTFIAYMTNPTKLTVHNEDSD